MSQLVKLAQKIFLVAFCMILAGCQLGYYVKGGIEQVRLACNRVSVEKIIIDPKTKPEDREKLELSQKAREFAVTKLGLIKNSNYTTFVQLDRSSLTYAVSAAQKWELKSHLWSFPIVGDVPYKGFFNQDDAKDLAKDLQQEGLDTYVRGVSAFSSLGIISDPIYSSMMKMEAHDLVNTVIHETVHATLFIDSNADFNERLAVFVGDRGTEAFYLALEGPDSKTLQKIKDEAEDQKLFAQFIGVEIKALAEWYKSKPEQKEESRQTKFTEIKNNFKIQVQPRLKTDSYGKFSEAQLNNARLLLYKTYISDLQEFESVFKKLEQDFPAFITEMKKLKNSKDPANDLKKLL